MVTPPAEAAPSITRNRYRPGAAMTRGLNRAYPLVVFPMRLRTLDVSVPVNPGAGPASLRREACITSCWTEPAPAALATGRTPTTTGRVNGTPGRTAAGGPISKVRPYSRLELAESVPAAPMTILSCWCGGMRSDEEEYSIRRGPGGESDETSLTG